MIHLFAKRVNLMLVLCLLAGLSHPARADALPDTAYIPGVAGHAQAYSLSCESRSAADWAAFWGVSIGETEFLDALPGSDNPDEGFVGSPNDLWGNIPPQGYGVHAGPVADLLNEYGLEAQAYQGLAWDDLRGEIAAGRPAIVWVIGQAWAGSPVEYTTEDGSQVIVARFEHTMILVGYSPDLVHVVDAYTGQNQTYALTTFLTSWAVLDNMAVLGGGEERPAPEPPTAGGDSYTVQPGDYLVALAERFGSTWQELALLNNIPYPYTIYAGQVLELPASPQEEQPPAEPEPSPTPAAPPPTAPEGPFLLHLPQIMRTLSAALPGAVPALVIENLQPTYTVQPGDTLYSVGQQVGIDWRSLAAANNIHYPFVIYPGQILKIR